MCKLVIIVVIVSSIIALTSAKAVQSIQSGIESQRTAQNLTLELYK